MPTYLYECNECGRFEEIQKISDDPLKKCPECGKDVRKIIGKPGVRFKGSGFYCNDHGKSGSSSANNKGDEKAS
jgi:putative FmdB family regulatory protein